MDVKGKLAVVTGGARGIGYAIADALIKAGAKVAIADLSEEAVQKAAGELGCVGFTCDVTSEPDVVTLIQSATAALGDIDLFLSNAGVGFGEPDHAASASNDTWQLCWDVHVMAHVYAARALLPGMIERGSGYLINTASAAGLLNQIGDAAYSATKHAAVSFAESLAISHGDDGIKASVICPQYVATPMLGFDEPPEATDHPGLITAADVAQAVMDGIADERFLILPHPQVAEYTLLKAQDRDRWLGGMRKLRRATLQTVGTAHPAKMYKMV